MRRVLVVTAVLGLAALAHAESKDGPRLAPRGPLVRSLPPGLWFVEGHYESFALESEPEAPRFAVVIGVHGTAASAEAASRRAASAPLDPGFPWIVTTRDLPLEGAPPDRIAVVVGLHVDRAAADGLARLVPHAHVIAISGTPHEPVWNDRGEEERLWVVHVDTRRDAVGFPLAAMQAIEAELDQLGFDTEEARRAAFEARLARAPTCTVRRGSVLATRSSGRYYGSSRRWAPARCGAREAVVPVESTMREAVLEYRGPSETWIHQVTDVMCDSANFDVWRWTSEGREIIEGREPTFTSGCAG